MTVAIIDYGSGNLRSAAKAFSWAVDQAGAARKVMVTSDPEDLRRADHIVLPGVGAFADCMRGLDAVSGMRAALDEQVVRGGKPFLGICVGMQLMADSGHEHVVTDGLGWLRGKVTAIEPEDGPDGRALKVPHMGWNQIDAGGRPHPVLDGLGAGAFVYFVHSYQLEPANTNERLAVTDYGGPVTAAVGRDNLIGTQFHPEKSQATGLRLIGNFLKWRP